MPRGIYARTKPTGFLHPVIRYEVREGAKIRHTGTNKRDAERAFTTWTNFAKSREGTPQPTTITLTADNQPIKTETIKP